MKFIVSIQGAAILHVSPDEIIPTGGLLIRDLLRVVGDTYQFSVKPEIPSGVPPSLIPAYVFQSGVLETEKEKIPISQLIIVRDGGSIMANTTDAADKVLDDYISRLDTTLGFRFASVKMLRTYYSNVVVQFDSGIEEKISAIGKIEAILNRTMTRRDSPFKIKRLAFGYGDPIQPTSTAIENFDSADFVIERRATELYSENRYFCGGPTRTDDLIEILELIERELSL
ncbi:MAG: hypothetical protein WA624_08990 [Methylocella sp.]